MNSAWVYILKCADGSYYTGKTQNIEKRIAEHQNGVFKGYTFDRRPVILVYSQEFSSYLEAIQAERQIKGWSRAKKEALINGDFNLLHELAKCRNVSHFKNFKRSSDLNE
jgi:predicted GIY-YIG superfamily endonuclease